jgi:nucleoside 2-deoxyribosyltransferase
MLTIVGGIYREKCMRPYRDEIYGSAGRAASAIAKLGGAIALHGYMNDNTQEVLIARAIEENFQVLPSRASSIVTFRYSHALAPPNFRVLDRGLPPIEVQADHVVRYGMLEGTAVVHADFAVYDPQNMHLPESFHQNGSTASHLAVVLNRYEACAMLGQRGLDPETTAAKIAEREHAEVVILKMGPQGALVWHAGKMERIPAYATTRVWKIGSGDQFVANFAYEWIEKKSPPAKAADRASRATAYYVQTGIFPDTTELNAFKPEPILVSDRYAAGHRPRVYLAGPFFTLGQRWVIKQARDCLRDMGLKVFSPIHDVGPGPASTVVTKDLDGIESCELMLAIADGLDSGTIYEIGYARRSGKPVVVYAESESEEDCKMMTGSDCFMRDDFVSAIYQTAWVAASL